MIRVISWPLRWFPARGSQSIEMAAFVPDEWRTANATLKAMNRVAGPLGSSYPRSLVAFAVPFVLGAVPAAFAMPVLARCDETTAMAIMAALLAFGGLLVGFVVTLMLFTGRLDNPGRLTYEQTEAYAVRLKYLLASQAMTLFAALILSTLSLVWMAMYAVRLPVPSLVVVGVTLCGFAGVCLMRMFLLPMQIFELHEESLDAAVEQKLQENQQRYRHTGAG